MIEGYNEETQLFESLGDFEAYGKCPRCKRNSDIWIDDKGQIGEWVKDHWSYDNQSDEVTDEIHVKCFHCRMDLV